MINTMRRYGVMDFAVRKFMEYFLEKQTDQEQTEELIEEVAGAYEIYMRDWEAYLSIRAYRNVNCAEAHTGQECGYIDISMYSAHGKMTYLRGYFSKLKGNVYSLSGQGLDGATVRMTSTGLILYGAKEGSGKYTKS